MPSTSWFGSSIKYEFKVVETRDFHGSLTNMDFSK